MSFTRDAATKSLTSRSVFSPVRIIKAVDRASPFLRQVAASGDAGTVTIDFVRRDGAVEPYTYLQIQLQGAIVNEVSMTTQSANSVSQEIVIFDYVTIKWTYWPLTLGGTVGSPISFGWNVATNSRL